MSGPNVERVARLAAIDTPAEVVAARAEEFRRLVLASSRSINVGNFTRIGDDDLALLFPLYDRTFFDGMLGDWLQADRAEGLEFQVSSRMTSAGGKTTRWRPHPTRQVPNPPARYRIAVSSTLLFQTFADVNRPVEVVGLACRDRLDALLRVFEHELIHLAEFLALGRSSCAAPPFRMVAQRVFGHLKTKHELVTPRELALTTLALRVGDQVGFDHEGQRWVGRINRITRRATVLVESPIGELFSDGRRYLRFYVPLRQLRKTEGA